MWLNSLASVLLLAGAAAAAPPATVRVLTYNVHHGEGTDGKIDLPRIAAVIKAADPDLVALQEVDNKCRRSGGVDQTAELARLTGLHGRFARQIDYDGGEYGQAILSRAPTDAPTVHWLPGRPTDRERRIAAAVRATVRGADLTFASTHLHHRDPKLRTEQAAKLDELFGKLGRPVILAGDFNATPDEEPLKLLSKNWTVAPAGRPSPTYPAVEPKKQLDYVLALQSGRVRVAEVTVIEEKLASDHRPVLAVLEVAAAPAEAADVRVMSYNVRYATAPDGENHWDKRKEFLAETVRAFDPDLLGTQETLAVQRDYLAGKLPTHTAFGVGRDDGREAGEMTAVYWRTDRFEKHAGGHVWLSESPDRPGVKGWDAAHPRLVTWVKLADKTAPGGKPILWLNTHLDNRGQKARVEGAMIVRARLAALGEGCSVVVTGDFNSPEGGEPYAVLFGKPGDRTALVDTFRAAHPGRGAEEGTTTGFKASATRGSRIDWIGCSRDWTVRAAGIDRTSRDGRTPSDHFPVTAVLRR